MSEQRAEARTISPDFARIIYGDWQSLPCRIVDRSRHGLRVAVHSTNPLPDDFTVEHLGTGEMVDVFVRWRTRTELGLRMMTADLKL